MTVFRRRPENVPDPGFALLPRLGRRPDHLHLAFALCLLVASALCLPALLDPVGRVSGDPSLDSVSVTIHRFWLAGPHAPLASGIQSFPRGFHRPLLDGYPLDAMLAAPWTALFGAFRAYEIFLLLVIWAGGSTMSWLAGRWWRSLPAAMLAGVTWEISAWTIRNVVHASSDRLLASAIAPVVVGLLLISFTRGRRGAALLAGMLAGACVLSSVPVGWYLLVAAGVLLMLSLARNPRTALGAAPFLGGLAAVLFAAFLIDFRSDSPSSWTLVQSGDSFADLAALANTRGQDLWRGFGAAPLLGFAVLPLALLPIGWAPARRWIAPVAWTVVGLWCASGAWIDVGGIRMPTPLALFLACAPMPADPTDALFLATFGATLLVGGGIHRVAARLSLPRLATLGFTALLVAEGWAFRPWLPLPTSSTASAVTPCLDVEETGPLLQLPIGAIGGPLLAQVHHARPMMNGPLPMAEEAGIQALLGCEDDRGQMVEPDKAVELRANLSDLGVRDVVVDTSVLPSAWRAGYLTCIRRMLGPPRREEATCEAFALPEEASP